MIGEEYERQAAGRRSKVVRLSGFIINYEISLRLDRTNDISKDRLSERANELLIDLSTKSKKVSTA